MNDILSSPAETETVSGSAVQAPAQKYGQTAEGPPPRFAAGRVLPLLAVSIFFSEALVHLVSKQLFALPPATEALTEAAVLVALLSPTFYFFHYRPLTVHARALQDTVSQLLASEERLNLALAAVNDGLWDWNIETSHVYFSPRGRSVLGYDPDELLPHFETWASLLHPADRDDAMKALEEHLAGVTPGYEVEYRLKDKNGKWIWVLARGRVVARDARGAPLRAVGTYTDISVRKKAEEQLRQREEDIRQLSRQLMATSEIEKKRVAQDLHDEFGQVLTAFQMGLEMLKGHSFSNEQDFQFQCDRLLSLSDRLQRDIRGICDRLRPAMLDDIGLFATLEWLVKEFAQQSPSIHFSYQAPSSGNRPSRESEVILFRICQEALNNCVKHSGATRVDVRLDTRDNGLFLSVRDNGRGIPLEQMHKNHKDHWGLGLLGMQERASVIHGKVHIDSTPGKGLTIEVFLPEAFTRKKDETDTHPAGR